MLCYIRKNFTIFELYISQGSVAACVGCGARLNGSFVAGFSLSLAVKEF